MDAAHIIGGDVSYACLGNDDYEITIRVYRDCQSMGAAFDGMPQATNMHVTIYNGDDSNPFVDPIELDPPVIENVDPSLGNPCIEVPDDVCVETGTYTFTVNLPESPDSYFVVYQRCCRNGTIDNIIDPGSQGATYYVEITGLAQSECNNSPVFNNFPPPVICVGEELNYDHSAFDVEGDQLIYSFCSPILGGGTDGATTPGDADSFTGVAPNPDAPPPYVDIPYVLPTYSAINPLGGSPPIVINPTTGLISGVPTTLGQFVVGICVSEYRNGQLLSRIQRDFQFNVETCEIFVDADIQGIDFDPAINSLVYNSCGDSTINFVNLSTDEQYIDTYQWRFNIDNDSVLALNQQNVDVTFPGPGEYSGTMVLNPGEECSDSLDFEVNIQPPLTPDFSFNYDSCVAGPVDFTDVSALASIYPLNIQTWEWDFGDDQIGFNPAIRHTYEEAGVYPVSLTITDDLGCEASFVDSVVWYPSPPVIVIKPSEESGCAPLQVSFENLSAPVDSTYTVLWDFGAAGFGEGLNPTTVFTEEGNYDIFIEITSPIGCYTDTLFTERIKVDTFPEAAFSFNPVSSTNFNPTIDFIDESERVGHWQWTFGEYDFETYEQNPSYTFQDTGKHEVELLITHYNQWNCYDTAYAVIDIVPEIRFFMPNAFTPNNDGKNEVFKPGGYLVGINNFNMQIWNRWGNIVFTSSNPENGWDGMTENGKPAMPGVYVYNITFNGPRGKPYQFEGFSTLIR